MKAAAFQELLESVRDAGADLRRNCKRVDRTDKISPRPVAVIHAKLKLKRFEKVEGMS